MPYSGEAYIFFDNKTSQGNNYSLSRHRLRVGDWEGRGGGVMTKQTGARKGVGGDSGN